MNNPYLPAQQRVAPAAPVSIARRAGQAALKVLAVPCAVLSLMGLASLPQGVKDVLAPQSVFLHLQPSQVGPFLGQKLGGPLGVAFLFGWFALRLWRAGGAASGAGAAAPRWRRWLRAGLRAVRNLFLFFAGAELVNAAAGMYAIVSSRAPAPDQGPLVFDGMHALYVWHPLGSMAIYLGVAIVSGALARWALRPDA